MPNTPLNVREATAKVEEAFARVYKKSATFPKGLEKGTKYRIVNQLMMSLMFPKVPVYLEGQPGIAKTAFVKTIAEALGYELVYLSGPTAAPENIGTALPTDGMLEFAIRGNLASPNEKIIFIDEVNRTSGNVENLLKEIIQQRQINGVPIQNVKFVWAAYNPFGSGFSTSSGWDLATATRVKGPDMLTANDTPWREWIAGLPEFITTDLTSMFAIWDRLSETQRAILSPRVLQNALMTAYEGLSPLYSIPAPDMKRARLVSASGDDETEVVLRKLVEAAGMTYRSPSKGDLQTALEITTRRNWNLHIIDNPGCGKTMYVKQQLRDAGLRMEYFHAPGLTPAAFSAVLPETAEDGRTVLKSARWRRLTGESFVLFVDEGSAASTRLQNVLMELQQERTLDGVAVPLSGYITASNPREIVVGVDSYGREVSLKMHVNKVDLAQASRFHITMIGVSDDIPSSTYLRDTYAYSEEELSFNPADAVEAWWENDLDEAGRTYVPARVKEMLIQAIIAQSQGLPVPLTDALPKLNGKRIQVPIVELELRLAGKSRASWETITADLSTWVGYTADSGPTGFHADEAIGVVQALLWTPLAKLEAREDAVVALLTWLHQSHKSHIITQAKVAADGDNRHRFLQKCLLAGHAAKKAAQAAPKPLNGTLFG